MTQPDLLAWRPPAPPPAPADDALRRFQEFDARHPHVWLLFRRFTLEKIAAGHEHYSADSVLHRIRWETPAGGADDEFRINNNWSAFYARKFHRECPQHAGFFRLRAAKADRERGGAA